jgi:hypothetical protein
MMGLANQWLEKRHRGANRLDGHVAVAAELDVNAVLIADVTERPTDRWKVHRPFAEHQVLVDTPAHVFDMNVDDACPPALQQDSDVALVQAMDVPKVDRQLKQRVANPFIEPGEACERIDEHARFRLEGQRHLSPFQLLEERLQGQGEPFHAGPLFDEKERLPRQQRHGVGLDGSGQVNGAPQAVEPAVQVCLQGLDESDPAIRAEVLGRLESIPIRREEIVAALNKFLERPDQPTEDRETALLALKELSVPASPGAGSRPRRNQGAGQGKMRLVD